MSTQSEFIDKAGRVDLERLRTKTLASLQELKSQADYLLQKRDNKPFWDYLHQVIVREAGDDDQKIAWLDVEAQIHGLPHMIETWMRTSVESSERMDIFVRLKAAEIKSHDEQKDYFTAIEIRHDQLIGLVKVLSTLMTHLERWVLMRAEEVIDDEVFLGIAEATVEEQIYLEAENEYRLRKK
jgi:hypothetical protein